MERTLVIIKPDGVQRGLIGHIIARLEQRGLKIVAMKIIQMDESLAKRLYAIHEGKPFFEGLISYIISSPVVVMVLEGKEAIKIVRSTMGATNPADAGPGTIRGDYGLEVSRNLVHGSDGPATAQQEITLFFNDNEILSYRRDVDRWVSD